MIMNGDIEEFTLFKGNIRRSPGLVEGSPTKRRPPIERFFFRVLSVLLRNCGALTIPRQVCHQKGMSSVFTGG
jgi:hypothetical protein